MQFVIAVSEVGMVGKIVKLVIILEKRKMVHHHCLQSVHGIKYICDIRI